MSWRSPSAGQPSWRWLWRWSCGGHSASGAHDHPRPIVPPPWRFILTAGVRGRRAPRPQDQRAVSELGERPGDVAEPTRRAIDPARRDRDRVRGVLVRSLEDRLRCWAVASLEDDRDQLRKLGVQQSRLENRLSTGARQPAVGTTAGAQSDPRARTRTDDDDRPLRRDSIAHAAHGSAGGVGAVEAHHDAGTTLGVRRTVTLSAVALGRALHDCDDTPTPRGSHPHLIRVAVRVEYGPERARRPDVSPRVLAGGRPARVPSAGAWSEPRVSLRPLLGCAGGGPGTVRGVERRPLRAATTARGPRPRCWCRVEGDRGHRARCPDGRESQTTPSRSCWMPKNSEDRRNRHVGPVRASLQLSSSSPPRQRTGRYLLRRLAVAEKHMQADLSLLVASDNVAASSRSHEFGHRSPLTTQPSRAVMEPNRPTGMSRTADARDQPLAPSHDQLDSESMRGHQRQGARRNSPKRRHSGEAPAFRVRSQRRCGHSIGGHARGLLRSGTVAYHGYRRRRWVLRWVPTQSQGG